VIGMEKKPIGKITHFFSNIGVAVVVLENEIKKGDKIEIGGKSEPFQQIVESMQIEKETIETASAGQAVGLKVNQPVMKGDIVYKITE